MSDDTGKAGMEGMEALFRGAQGDKGDKGEPGMTHGAKRAVSYLLVLVLLLVGAVLVIGAREFAALEKEIRAQCKENADVGTAPILTQKGLKPSLLGVTIVSDARVGWHQAGCPGVLPPAQPSFLHWAKYYKVPYQ